MQYAQRCRTYLVARLVVRSLGKANEAYIVSNGSTQRSPQTPMNPSPDSDVVPGNCDKQAQLTPQASNPRGVLPYFAFARALGLF